MRLRAPVDWLSHAWPFRAGEDGKAKAPRRRRTSRLENMDFSNLTLEALLKLEPGLMATKLHIVTLRSFRVMVGEEWPRLVERVGMIVDGVMRRYLGPKGLYSRYGEDTFILGFTTLSEEEGRRQAVLVVNELMQRLIGERFVGAQICLAEADAKDILDADGQLDPDAMETRIAEAEPVAEAAPAGDADAAGDGEEAVGWTERPPDADRPEARLVPVEQKHAEAEAGPRWVPLVWPPEGQDRPAWAEELSVGALDALPDGIEIVFRPVWNARWQAIDAYACVARRRMPDGRTVEHGLLPKPVRPRMSANLDFATLHAGLTRLAVAIERRQGSLLVVPLRFATLQAPHWAILAGILRAIPDATRMRYLVLEVVNVPKAAKPEHMVGLAAMLRPLCRDILVRTALGDPRFGLMAHLQPAAVGCDLAALAPGAAAPEALQAFAEAAGRQRFYAWGAGNGTAVAAAVALGARFVNGSAIMPDAPEPQGRIELPDGPLSARAVAAAAASAG
jgi:hypothetical protein